MAPYMPLKCSKRQVLWRNCIRWYCMGFLHNAFELGHLAVFLCVFKLIERRLTSGRALQSSLHCDLGSIGTSAVMMQPNLARWRLLTSGCALQSPLHCDLGSIGTSAVMMQPNLARWRLLTSGRALQSPLRCDLGSVSAGALTLQPNLARWRQSC